MSHEAWLMLSGFLVSATGLYYAVLVGMKLSPCNPVTWGAWSIIGVAIFITSKSVFGFNAITFGMLNPIVVTLVGAIRQYQAAERPSKTEWAGGIVGVVAIATYWVCTLLGMKNDWTLALSIIADVIPSIPIIINSWEHPDKDVPTPWMIFGFGYGISAFGQAEWNSFTLALPIYMFLGANILALPLARYRFQKRTPWLRWIY